MANLTVLDGAGATKTLKADDNAGILTPHHVAEIPDGVDVTTGALADAVVAAGAAGSVSAKLRRLTTDLATLLTQTDGLEASLTAIDASQGAAADAVVAAGAAGSTAAKLRRLTTDLNTLLGYTDGLEALLTAIAASVAGTLIVDTELPAAAALADAASNPTTALAGACLLVWNGATWDRLRAASVRKDLATVAIGSIATVWTPASGKKVRLMGGCISLSAAASILFEDNASGTTVFRTPKLAVDTPYNFDLGQGVLLSVANNVLKATSSAAANLLGSLYGTEES